MGASKCCPESRMLALLGLALCGTAQAETSSHAELTCLLDSGDVLGSSQANPVEDPPWQNLASLRRGDENRVRLAVTMAQAGLLPSVTTSAVLRVELGFAGPTGSQAPELRDLASSVAVAWRLAPRAELMLRAFPFDTDYLRLGYLHALDWGGTDANRGESVFLRQTGSVPGFQVALSAGKIRLFSALKWARLDDALVGRRRLWGLLSGGSAELLPALRVEGGFGYFQRPRGAPFASPDAFVEGASARVVWHHGVAEPELSAEPFRPPRLGEDPSRFDAAQARGWAIALEGVTLVVRREGSTDPSRAALEPAPAAAFYGSVQGHGLAAHGAVTWRSLPFVLRNDSRFAQTEGLPRSRVEQAEVTGWLGGSATLASLYLVPSIELGLRLPAALQIPSVLPGFGQMFVATGATGLAPLPVGAGRLPVVSARLGARFQASGSVALSLFGELTRDPNRVGFATTSSGVVRAFARPERFALVAAVQARF
jgi:hypothetical protein